MGTPRGFRLAVIGALVTASFALLLALAPAEKPSET